MWILKIIWWSLLVLKLNSLGKTLLAQLNFPAGHCTSYACVLCQGGLNGKAILWKSWLLNLQLWMRCSSSDSTSSFPFRGRWRHGHTYFEWGKLNTALLSGLLCVPKWGTGICNCVVKHSAQIFEKVGVKFCYVFLWITVLERNFG